MIQKDLNWTSKDGLKFFAHTWEPDETPKATITLVHGFGEHCMRYTPYFEYFIKEGFAVLGFDQRGHGQTEGKRGVINSYDGLLDDIDMALQKTKDLFPNIPQFIYGNSMGGNLIFNYLIRKNTNLKGGIASSPWFTLTKQPNTVLIGIVNLLKYIVPNITIDGGLDPNDISSDKLEAEKYLKDPLNHGRISFRLLSGIINSGLWAISNSNKLKTPVLMMHGTADNIASPISSKKAAENNPGKIKYIEWSERYHELHNEPNRAEVAQAVINWLNQKL